MKLLCAVLLLLPFAAISQPEPPEPLPIGTIGTPPTGTGTLGVESMPGLPTIGTPATGSGPLGEAPKLPGTFPNIPSAALPAPNALRLLK